MAAAMATTPPSGRDGKNATEGLPMPSRNPLPLSASQEAQVREVFNARVRMQCQDEIKGVCYHGLPTYPSLLEHCILWLLPIPPEQNVSRSPPEKSKSRRFTNRCPSFYLSM